VRRLGDHERELASRVDQANRQLTEQQQRLDRASAARRKFESRTEIGSKLQMAGAQGMAAGAAATAPGFVAARAAMSFEDALADANKVLNLSNSELAQMRKETLALSKQVPLTPQQIMVIKAAGA